MNTSITTNTTTETTAQTFYVWLNPEGRLVVQGGWEQTCNAGSLRHWGAVALEPVKAANLEEAKVLAHKREGLEQTRTGVN